MPLFSIGITLSVVALMYVTIKHIAFINGYESVMEYLTDKTL